jgi:hypothetical protein
MTEQEKSKIVITETDTGVRIDVTGKSLKDLASCCCVQMKCDCKDVKTECCSEDETKKQ